MESKCDNCPMKPACDLLNDPEYLGAKELVAALEEAAALAVESNFQVLEQERLEKELARNAEARGSNAAARRESAHRVSKAREALSAR